MFESNDQPDRKTAIAAGLLLAEAAFRAFASAEGKVTQSASAYERFNCGDWGEEGVRPEKVRADLLQKFVYYSPAFESKDRDVRLVAEKCIRSVVS